MDFARLAVRAGLMLALVSGLAACAYPSEPRYSIHADQGGAVPGPPPPPGPGTFAPPLTTYEDGSALPPTNPYTEVPAPVRAPTESIQGGALDFPTSPVTPAAPAPVTPSAPRPSTAAGVAYEIQAGDTISGVGRRFGTPVQTLIDLNSLGPRGAITPGQRIRLPDNAIDRGHDPYATGPSPIGVEVVEGAAPPPPPPPPSGNAPMPPRTDTGSVSLAWPLRGDIVRRFGAVGVSERNNGVNIAAADGTEVRASAAGRVGYVGDDLAGQGMTVLIVHRDGWRTVYGHLGGRPTVRDGEEVTAGQVIGRVGNTAGDGRPSIHFEVWRMRGDSPSAVDPLSVLPR